MRSACRSIGVVMSKRSFLSALSLGSGTLFSLPAMAETAGSDRRSWQPDGLGYRARIGLLTPNDDAVPESEFWTMAPEGVSVHVGRVLLVNTRTFSDPPHPDDATVLLTGAAAVAAFRALGVRRIALIHPPWFSDDEQELGVAYFRNQGFEVVYANQMHLRGFSVAKPTDPLRKFTEVYPAELYAFARTEVPTTAEAIFFGGNGFRAIGMIAALEQELGRRVLTGNQVVFWNALRQAGVRAPVNGYGRVFTTLNSAGI